MPFTWSAFAGAQGYYLALGTTAGGYELVNSGVLAPGQTSFNVPDLPAGPTLYATLLTQLNGSWDRYQVVTFTAAVGHASLSTPTTGQANVSTTAPFAWSALPGAQNYYLVVGTTVGGYDLVNSGVLAAGQTSFNVPDLPAGPTLYATLLTQVNGSWRFQLVSFTAAAGHAAFTAPVDGQTNVTTTQPFTWSTVSGAQHYYVVVGTTPGGFDLVNSGILAPAESSLNMPALPAGRLLHATVLTEVNGTWRFQAISFTTAAIAARGSLDPTFGTDGHVTIAPSHSGPTSLAYVAATGQSLVAFAITDPSGSVAFFIDRLSSAGAIENTFSLPAGMGVGQVLNGGDGKMLAVGTPTNGATAPGSQLVRLTATGALDPTFGTGGVVITSAGAPNSPRRAVIGPDGRIFVATMLTTGPSTTEMGIAAFTPNGAVDTTFAGTGIASTTFGGSVGLVGLAIQPNGDLVVDSGVMLPAGTHTDAVVARFVPTGQLDNTFADHGVFERLLGGTSDYLNNVAVEANGNLLVGGIQFTSQSGSTPPVGLIAEITSLGVLNTSFGSGGTILEAPPGSVNDFKAVATAADGGFYGLLMEQDGPFVASIRRYSADGKPDLGFGSAGVVTLNNAIPIALVIAYQGRPEIAFGVPPDSATVVAERFFS